MISFVAFVYRSAELTTLGELSRAVEAFGKKFCSLFFVIFCDVLSFLCLFAARAWLYSLSSVRLAIRRGGFPPPYGERLPQLRRDGWTT
jgi:hypothetical protein